MSKLLPSLQADEVRRGIVAYLATTFALADAEPRAALADFLDDPVDGIFKGPYLRLRLPFKPADPGWADLLDWTPPFPPYRHQAQAYARLSSKDRTGEDRPLPTIVTTGTGSGKTEAFLHPILDHVVRARRRGEDGIKALVLYPMNALADDQALRLTALLTGDPALAGIRAGVYTGDAAAGQAGDGRTVVSERGLITSRSAMRADPPDILLTNYKMLDQLLLRPEDRHLWRRSATSLTYLVLDEFHTYDGAQGTDVALLLRRLGRVLAHHAPHPPSAPWAGYALGPVTPVATSATLGDGSSPQAMLDVASEVFGRPIEADAAVTETRYDIEEFAQDARHRVQEAGAEPIALNTLMTTDLADLAAIGRALRGDGAALTDAVTAHLYGQRGGLDPQTLLRAHPGIHALLDATREAVHADDLLPRLFAANAIDDRAGAREALSAVVAALSHIRLGDRSQAGVETTVWVREVTRLDRLASSEPGFRWADDGDITASEDGHTALSLPAVHCRSCGRSGWGVLLAPTGRFLADKDTQIRTAHAQRQPRFRALLHAPGEWLAHTRTDQPFEPTASNLRWLHVTRREILTRPPQAQDPDLLAGQILPVLALDGDTDDVERRAKDDECPSCGKRDQIRFLGSSVATLLSVTLTTLFGDPHLDPGEKRALVFTDSVQDAAHRAGFIDHRSHAMSLRAALRNALTNPTTLDQWVRDAMDHARDDAFARYRLVPAALATHDLFSPYWSTPPDTAIPARVHTAVERRLAFDAALEIGLQTTYGRTLEATGAIGVHVHATPATLTRVARTALTDPTSGELPLTLAPVTDQQLLTWARGAVEHLRRDGAIVHPWLDRYVTSEGARIWIWGKRPVGQGAPAFPTGRSAPAFALVGGRSSDRSAFVPVTSPQSWYARWAARCLGISPGHGASAAARLLAALAHADILTARPTDTDGQAYGIDPTRIVLTPLTTTDLDTQTVLLACTTCRTPMPTSPHVGPQLLDGPCPMVRCTGRMEAHSADPHNFYRHLFESTDMRRVDAHEHTSLLDPALRHAIETGFKREQQRPADPNVLVATPTLEMGIDIGDLTTVLLSSLPRTVAQYTQRVGRAGRRTGSSLALAYVTGRGDQLPRLGAPTSLLNGTVRPPATYLRAEEILRRQFLAFVIDTMIRDGYDSTPRTSGAALASAAPGSFLGEVLARVERDGSVLLAEFAQAFAATCDGPDLDQLRAWVRPDDDPMPLAVPVADTTLPAAHAGRDTLAATVHRAVHEHTAETDALERQGLDIEKALPDLIARAAAASAVQDDRDAERNAHGALRVLSAVLAELRQEPWISGLERRGLLPNYTLLDDTVELHAQVSWSNPETEKYESDTVVLGRGSARAITELAPGAHFYARGLHLQVHGVDIGRDTQIQHVAVCDSCGHVAQLEGPDAHAPSTCPRCASIGIADVSQRLDVLRLTRVFSDVRRDDARIDDSTEDRHHTRFEVLTAVDFDPTRLTDIWSVPASGLGVAHYRRIAIRWLNLGLDTAVPATRRLAGREAKAVGFRVCDTCGHLDTDAGRSSAAEHRAWCRHRNDLTEHTRDLALGRELITQALALTLPADITGDALGTVSIEAALLLGLRELMGGSPDHVRIVTAQHPVADADTGQTRTALVLHDTVPGGTGYLTDLARPDRIWTVLVLAGRLLETCPCRDEGRTACYRCLLPFTRDTTSVSRTDALRAIRALLAVPTTERLADLDPTHPTWTTVGEAPDTEVLNPLEQVFRDHLAERLAATATVHRRPGPRGTELHIATMDGRRWAMRPQLDTHGCRPDYVLTPNGGAVSVAVFTDGYAYHATPALNRLADDATKRQALRDAGYVVIAVTDADLHDAPTPAWLDDRFVSTFLSIPAGGFTRSAFAEQQGGPLALLDGLVRDPDDPARRRLAAAGALLTGLVNRTTYAIEAHESLDAVAVAVLDGTRPPVDTRPPMPGDVIAYRNGHLALLAHMADMTPQRYSLLLDDRPGAVESPDFQDSWKEWLRLSNLLATSEIPLAVHTRSTALAAATPVVAVLDSPWPEIDLTGYDDDARTLAAALAAADTPSPQAGIELENGSMAELAWPEQRIAVVHDDMDDDERADIAAAGWRTYRTSTDPRTIAAALHEEN